jgi:hypothetical protein
LGGFPYPWKSSSVQGLSKKVLADQVKKILGAGARGAPELSINYDRPTAHTPRCLDARGANPISGRIEGFDVDVTTSRRLGNVKVQKLPA